MSDLLLDKKLNQRLKKDDGIPHNRNKDYDKDFIDVRRKWVEDKTKTKLKHIGIYSEETENFRGNIENFIGVCQMPIGIAGPLRINGQHAKGDFYVPLATTEGALVMTYHRGMRVLTKSGGANVQVLKDELHISPEFYVDNLADAQKLIGWIKTNFGAIKREAEGTTKHGKLLNIEPIITGRRVITKFTYFTEDAQGLNMVNKASEKACIFIEKNTKKEYILRSNFSSIKKVSTHNYHCGEGKSVFAEAVVPKDVIRLLGVTPEDTERYFKSTVLASIQAGAIGENAHIANGVAALFIACGQDAADVSASHVGISMCEVIKGGALYISIYIPNLFVGSVGGGTGLGTQRECLEMMGCYGSGKAKKLAEIIGATALAGEVAVLAAVTGRTYVQAHEKYGRNKPEEKYKEKV